MRTIPFTAEIEIQNNKRIDFINDEIHALFAIHLVTCAECGRINSFPHDHIGEYTCLHCGITDEQCHFPDLFH